MALHSQPAADVNVCRLTLKDVSHRSCLLQGHKEKIRNVTKRWMSKLTLFLKRWLLYTCFLKHSQLRQPSDQLSPAGVKTKLSFMFHLDKNNCLTCVFHDCTLKLHEKLSIGAVEVPATFGRPRDLSGGVSAMSSWRKCFWWRHEKKKRIETKTSLTTLHFGDSAWRPPGMGRQSGKKRRFGLSASYPAIPQTHPKCLLLFLLSFSLIHFSFRTASHK